MKSGKPLKRSTPLRSRTQLTRSTPAQRATHLTRVAVARRRARVTPEERHARKVVKARAEGRCEGCGKHGPTDYSHRVGEGVGGPWAPSNAMALCRYPCHNDLHRYPLEARTKGWYLRSHENFRTIPVRHAWLGRVLLLDDGTTIRYEREAA